MTPDQWHEAEALAVQGVKYEQIGRRFGVSVGTLRQRARDHDWQTPGRVAWKCGREEHGVVVAAPETPAELSELKETGAALVPFQEALKAAAGVNPQAFQHALADYAQALIAEGAPNIPPPRSAGELSRINDLYRKASGLDAKQGPGDTLHIRPMRSLRRSIPVVEVEEVANVFEGFEI